MADARKAITPRRVSHQVGYDGKRGEWVVERWIIEDAAWFPSLPEAEAFVDADAQALAAAVDGSPVLLVNGQARSVEQIKDGFYDALAAIHARACDEGVLVPPAAGETFRQLSGYDVALIAAALSEFFADEPVFVARPDKP